ncbi:MULTISPECIES: CHASE3 domain-containing protein [Agrobacterium]|uniref:CHASE3 domain-containing protein n=1 Tax=Agrobacterium TaxID=357 RepID=UPI0018782710|nr:MULTISPECIES: CHASE3 domain-containing protein [Agrobacterium]MDH0873881.1 CHASE3 domain-containing protein [Agrobacterium pusense]MDH1271484.1 CHASE3 domain-containing protein [Agrobacterium pusense]
MVGLLAAIVFFVASAALSFFTVQNIRDNSARVTQTHSLIVALDLLLIDLQDAETGLRGYLLTGDDEYLEPYNRA